MRKTAEARFIVVALLLLLTGIAAPRPAGAQSPPTVHSWALAPTGTNPEEPSLRPYLTYTLAPGATVNDSVTLWNYSNVRLDFRVYATDAFNNDGGAFDLLTGDQSPVDLGAWVQLAHENVTVPALSKIDIPLTLTLPADARPGDHAAAILASSAAQGTNDEGKLVTLDRRTGSRMYVRVDGPLTPALVVEGVFSAYDPSPNPTKGKVDVTYTVRNTGNVRLRGHQEIVVRNPLGKVMKRLTLDDLPELLPGNAITRAAHFDGVLAAFRVGTEVRVEPFSEAGDEVSSKAVARTSHDWAVPWTVLGLAAVVILLWKLVRRRRARPMGLEPAAQGHVLVR